MTHCPRHEGGTIDRQELVYRHVPQVKKADPLSPFSVGNGKFAYTADITGLQTFPEFYEDGIPLSTQSDWGWHTIPIPINIPWNLQPSIGTLMVGVCPMLLCRILPQDSG
jgi:hypothetical protein